MSALYLRIVEDLKAQRRTLKVPLGLPDEPSLATKYSVARATIRRALKVLENEGAVTRKQGIGTYLQPEKMTGHGLKGKRIGIVPPWWAEKPGNWYYSIILDGISRWADENDCAFTILHAAARPLHEHLWLERIRRQELAGIVWVQPQESQLKLLFKTAKLFPTIVLGRTIAGKGLHHVIPDYQRAAELIDHHLVAHGHTVYGVIGKNVFDPYLQVWIDCFRQAFRKREAEFQTRPYFLDYGSFNQNRLGDLIMDFYLPDHREIQALVFPTSGCLANMQLHHRFCESVGNNLSVVTTNYGLHPIESVLPGRQVTHITYDWSQMAYLTLDSLALLAAGHQIPENITHEVQLVTGDSVHQISNEAAA